MIRTILTPDNQDVSIHIPEKYVGKQIEVMIYAVDELNNGEKTADKRKNFRGSLNLTAGQYQDFQDHLKNIRNEWDKDI